MAAPKVTITRVDGGLNYTAPGEEHISGLALYASGSTTGLPGNGYQVFYGLPEAESIGITQTATDIIVQHLWLHIRDFFRMHPSGILHTYLGEEPSGTQTFAEVTALAASAQGTIRQVAIHVAAAFSSTLMSAAQVVTSALRVGNRPLVAVIGFGSYPATGSLVNLHTLNCPDVGVLIGHLDDPDSVFIGDQLEVDLGHKVNSIGLLLGAIAVGKLGVSPAYVRDFDLTKNRSEGILIRVNGSLDENVLDSIHDKGYMYLKQFDGVAGVYLNLDQTAALSTSDYRYIRNVKVANKAHREVYVAIVKEVNAPIELLDNGDLPPEFVSYLTELASDTLDDMKLASAISGYIVSISAKQNVVTTNKILVGVRILPLGCSSYIDVEIGFTTSISA